MTSTRDLIDPRTLDDRSPALATRRPWHTTVREVALIAAAALLYTLVRGLTDDRVPVAFANADAVISFERGLGIFVEPGLQAVVLGREFVIDVVNAVYIAYWPIVVGALVWVMLRHPGHYPFYRNAVLTSGSVSLVIFALYPLAPPRFLPEHGFVDTIAANSAGYRDFNASALVNEYAAMPSLHLGWVLLVSIAIFKLGRSRAVRATAAVLPVAMFGAIVLTGNHYIVDGIAGGVVVLVGLATARTLRRWHAGAQPPISTRRTAASDDDVLVLRHELAVLRCQIKRFKLRRRDKLFLSAMSRMLPRERWAAFVVTPATLVRWHRELVRRTWTLRDPHPGAVQVAA